MSDDNLFVVQKKEQQQQKDEKRHSLYRETTGLTFNLIDLHDQLNMCRDFLHLKNKENGMDDEFHDKILLDLITLNHISY
jgi:hypothetical protein